MAEMILFLMMFLRAFDFCYATVLKCEKEFTLMRPCMPGRNISILLNYIYFENLFRDIGFSSSYCFFPVYLTVLKTLNITLKMGRLV